MGVDNRSSVSRKRSRRYDGNADRYEKAMLTITTQERLNQAIIIEKIQRDASLWSEID